MNSDNRKQQQFFGEQAQIGTSGTKQIPSQNLRANDFADQTIRPDYNAHQSIPVGKEANVYADQSIHPDTFNAHPSGHQGQQSIPVGHQTVNVSHNYEGQNIHPDTYQAHPSGLQGHQGQSSNVPSGQGYQSIPVGQAAKESHGYASQSIRPDTFNAQPSVQGHQSIPISKESNLYTDQSIRPDTYHAHVSVQAEHQGANVLHKQDQTNRPDTFNAHPSGHQGYQSIPTGQATKQSHGYADQGHQSIPVGQATKQSHGYADQGYQSIPIGQATTQSHGYADQGHQSIPVGYQESNLSHNYKDQTNRPDTFNAYPTGHQGYQSIPTGKESHVSHGYANQGHQSIPVGHQETNLSHNYKDQTNRPDTFNAYPSGQGHQSIPLGQEANVSYGKTDTYQAHPSGLQGHQGQSSNVQSGHKEEHVHLNPKEGVNLTENIEHVHITGDSNVEQVIRIKPDGKVQVTAEAVGHDRETEGKHDDTHHRGTGSHGKKHHGADTHHHGTEETTIVKEHGDTHHHGTAGHVKGGKQHHNVTKVDRDIIE